MTPLELWQSFVDAFATLHDGVHERWVAEQGSYPEIEGNRDINALLAGLSPEQRSVLVRMLVEARRGGIHDALVRLNDRMALREGRYSEGDVEMAFQPYGNPLFYDYVGRRDGAGWNELEWSDTGANNEFARELGPGARK